MKNLVLRVVLLVTGLTLLVACRSVQAPGSSLLSTSWVLSSLNGQLPLPGTTVTLQLGADGSATGSDGCNRYNIAYMVSGSNITFGQPGAATLMACPEPVMQQATAYMQGLAEADKYEATGSQLTLLKGSQVVATFVGETQALTGTSWQVTAYNNGRGGVVSLMIGTEITAIFDDSGQLTGSGGCNDYFASYREASGGNILVSAVGATRKACLQPPGVMEQEGEYLAALQSAATYRIEGNQLEMRNGEGAIALQMARNVNLAVPAPAPGKPTGHVTAPNGVNIRTGPGISYPVIGTAPFGVAGQVVGRSADRQWWAVSVPAAPEGIGWVSADYVAVTNDADVPVLTPPPPVYIAPALAPVATPTAVPPPTATPAAQIAFWASQTSIDQGQCTTINWSVEYVQAVWIYPQGQPYQEYPRGGQGSEQVCPPTTTTYEMLVILRDDSAVTRQVTVDVAAPAATPATTPTP